MSQKGQAQVLLLAGIVILIALAGGIFFLGRVITPKLQNVSTSSPQPRLDRGQPSPTPNEATDWKTYTNTKYGFSLSYPSEWSYEEKNNSSLPAGSNYIADEIIFGELSTINHIGETVNPYVSRVVALAINSSNELTNKTIEDFMNLSQDLRPNFQDTKIDNVEAKQVTHLGCLSADCMNVLLKKDNMIFDFSIDNATNNRNKLNQILSTFKFLD